MAEFAGPERLTEDGENLQAVFSPDGQRILYISRGREDHKNAQVYERNLSLKQENRITFQNGDVSRPRYVPDKEEILYASSTDELKENSPFLREKLKQESSTSGLPPELQELSEIYLHRLDGSGMTRLTQHPGFDGWPLPVKKDGFIWTVLDKGRLHIKTRAFNGLADMNLSHKNAGQFTPIPKTNTAAWIAYAEDFKSSSLWIQVQKKKNVDTLELAPDLKGLKTDPVWDSTGTLLLFAYQATPSDPFKIYSVNADGTCLTLQSRSKANERYPALSPDNSTLIFSSDAKKGWQIYRRSWTRPCPLPPK